MTTHLPLFNLLEYTVQNGVCILLAMLLQDEHQSLEDLCFCLVRLTLSLPDNRRKTVELRLSVKYAGPCLLPKNLTGCPKEKAKCNWLTPGSASRLPLNNILSSFYQSLTNLSRLILNFHPSSPAFPVSVF